MLLKSLMAPRNEPPVAVTNSSVNQCDEATDRSLSRKLSIGLAAIAASTLFALVAVNLDPTYGGLLRSILISAAFIAAIYCLSFARSVRQLEHAVSAALASDKVKSDLIANARHELSTPAGGIVGLANLLKPTDLDDHQKEMVHLIADSASSLILMLKDLTDYQGKNGAENPSEWVEFDPTETVRSVVGMFAEQARQKEIALNSIAQPNLPQKVSGDLKAFRQITSNLVGNAVKFTDDGKVDVGIELTSVGDSQIRMQLDVIDTGPGIAVDQISKVFDRSHRVRDGVSNLKEGSGLGLSICKALSEDMGGDIDVQSDVGKGSQFTFTTNFRRIEMGQAT